MSILYNRIASVYRFTRNANNVRSQGTEPIATVRCNIQPLSKEDITRAGVDGGALLNALRLYTDYQVKVGDKLVVESTTYIVNQVSEWNGSLRKYYKALITESNGN